MSRILVFPHFCQQSIVSDIWTFANLVDVKQYLVVLFVFYQYIWVYFYMLISCLSIKVSYLKNKTEDSTKYVYSSLIRRTESKQPSATIQLWSVRIWTLLIWLFCLLDIWFPSHILTCLLWLPPSMFLKAAENTDFEISFHTDGIFKHHHPPLMSIFVSKDKSG